MIKKVCICCEKQIRLNKNFCEQCLATINKLVFFDHDLKKRQYLFKNDEPVHSLLIEAKQNYLIYKALLKHYLSFLKISQSVQYVTWVPSINKNKLHSRYIAKFISKKFNLKLKNLVKNTSNFEAKQLNLEMRKKNLHFTTHAPKNIGNILVVDDIETSGNTFNKIVQSFEQNGVKNIYTFAIARTYLKSHSSGTMS